MICLFIYGQVDYDTYFATAGNNKEEFKIQITEKKGVVDEVYIYSKSVDNTYDKCVLVVKAKKLGTFVDYLKYVNTKFKEWSETAIKNKVDDFSKDIDADLRDYYSVGFAYDDWYMDSRVKLKSMFAVNEGDPIIYIYTGTIYSNSNSYIQSKGLFMPFATPEDLQELIDKLDVSMMQRSLSKNSDTENLFN
ncbi:hypothetical protein BC792_12772 [Sphingobacterium allocomposti]|uniref:Uncharacterized protein n=2 Tax=Sphingobacterium allocomposti TaxID=415956 RepID=A0A5S5D0C2_9SPHI|nr:hypothetical protein BC792_12772 [Sphingobacterium composti Yoo et al. 2007 non Ten et al. 2007]